MHCIIFQAVQHHLVLEREGNHLPQKAASKMSSPQSHAALYESTMKQVGHKK